MNSITMIHDFIHKHAFTLGVLSILLLFPIVAASFVVANGQSVTPNDTHIVTLYIDGKESIIPTRAEYVGELIEKTVPELTQYDLVEPRKNTRIDTDDFTISVYKARPVTIIDGTNVKKVMSPYQGAKMIAEKAGFTVYNEDILTIETSDNFVEDLILGEKVTIERSTPITLTLFGKTATVRTQATTAEELLKEKEITLSEKDKLSATLSAPITSGMKLAIWREGKQTITQEETIQKPIRTIKDVNKPIGYEQVQTAGKDGKKLVTYEIEIRDGKEYSRTVISSVVIDEAEEEVVIIGAKSSGALSQSKGVNIFTDSKGVAHRETYYDLNMSGTMGFCNGTYTVRADGVKVDQNGYVLVAANLNKYPRCSIVETSLGLGKVYDTGGFVLVHPDGFDLATDWSNRNGI